MSKQVDTKIDRNSKLAADRTDELARLARLCADGEIPFPADHERNELKTLSQLIRQHRRNRLMDFLALQIACSLLNRP